MKKRGIPPDPEKTIIDKKNKLTTNDLKEVERIFWALINECAEWDGRMYPDALRLAGRITQRPDKPGIIDRISQEISLAIETLEPIGATGDLGHAEKASRRKLGSFLRVAKLNVVRDQ